MAMIKYSIQEYDSALYYVDFAIGVDPQVAYPYTTLAETYAFMEQHESFYQSVEKALERGFNLSPFLQEAPYNRYEKDARFQALLRKEK